MLAKLNHKSFVATVLLLVGTLSMHCSLAMSDSERQAKLEELKSTISQLQAELKEVKSNRDGLMNDLESTESKIGELSKKVKKLKMQLEQQQSQLQQLKSEKEALARVKKQQLGSVKQQLQAAYRLGRQNSLTMLLNQQDPSQLSRNLHYYNRIVSAQAEKIRSYAATIERLNDIEPRIQATALTLEQNHQSLSSEREKLLQRVAERQQTLKKLNRLLNSKDAELAALEKDRKDLEALIQRVVMVSGDLFVEVSNRPFGELKGKLPWPTRGQVTETFGSSRVANKMQWQGMVIKAEEGAPVYAVHHGRVVFSDYLRGQGLLLIIDHGDGYMSLYAHNQTLFKDLGDWVSAGEQIASLGQSGGQQSARLYFELRYKGAPTNPQPWLKKAA